MSDLIDCFDGATEALCRARAINELICGYHGDAKVINDAAAVVGDRLDSVEENLKDLYTMASTGA